MSPQLLVVGLGKTGTHGDQEDQGCEGYRFDLCLVFCGGVGEHGDCVVFGGRRGSPWVTVSRLSWVLKRRRPWWYRELCVYEVLVLISVGLRICEALDTDRALNRGERNQSLPCPGWSGAALRVKRHTTAQTSSHPGGRAGHLRPRLHTPPPVFTHRLDFTSPASFHHFTTSMAMGMCSTTYQGTRSPCKYDASLDFVFNGPQALGHLFGCGWIELEKVKVKVSGQHDRQP